MLTVPLSQPQATTITTCNNLFFAFFNKPRVGPLTRGVFQLSSHVSEDLGQELNYGPELVRNQDECSWRARSCNSRTNKRPNEMAAKPHSPDRHSCIIMQRPVCRAGACIQAVTVLNVRLLVMQPNRDNAALTFTTNSGPSHAADFAQDHRQGKLYRC